MRAINIIRKELKNNILSFLVFLTLGLITSASTVIIPRITGLFVDSLIGNINLQILIRYCMLFGCITLLSIVTGYFNNRLYVKLKTTIVFDFKKFIIEQFRRSDIIEIKNLSIPETVQMSDRDLEFIISNILTVMQSAIINMLLVVASIFILLKINIYVAILLLIVTVAYVILFFSFKGIIVKINRQFLADQTKYFKKYFEQFRDIEFVKNNVLNKVYDKYLDVSYKKFFSTSLEMQKINYSFNSIDKFCMTISQIILFFIGGREVINSSITVGEFTILSTYFSLALTSIRYFLNLGKLKKEVEVSIDRVDRIINLKKDFDGDIRLSSIENLEVNLSQEPIFKESRISCESIKFIKGKMYTITGSNGSGKTTLMNILSGLYRNTGVKFYINNISAEDINMEFNRKYRFAILEQFPKLVEGTIEENILLGVDVNTLKNNDIDYLTRIFKLNRLYKNNIDSEFINLSGGEIKKISIVRTLLKESDVLLMDEPTVSLDAESKKLLIDYLVKLKKDKIVIITSHDEDLISNSDYVLNI